jgi:hypothetical protein
MPGMGPLIWAFAAILHTPNIIAATNIFNRIAFTSYNSFLERHKRSRVGAL